MDYKRFCRAIRQFLLLSRKLVLLIAWSYASAGPPREMAGSVELVRQLIDDRCWAGAARECRRFLVDVPDSEVVAALLQRIEAAGHQIASPESSVASRIVEGIVRSYRRWISVAIGSRCSLTPSCSEYFRQAARRHGWLAFPMIADRFVREPSVVAASNVRAGTPIPDPLEDHDAWLPRRRP